MKRNNSSINKSEKIEQEKKGKKDKKYKRKRTSYE